MSDDDTQPIGIPLGLTAAQSAQLRQDLDALRRAGVERVVIDHGTERAGEQT